MSVNLVTVHHEGAGAPTNDASGFAGGGYSCAIGTSRWERLRSVYVSYATLHFNHVSLDICLSGMRQPGLVDDHGNPIPAFPVTDNDIMLIHGAYMDFLGRGEVTTNPLVRPHRFSPGSSTVCPGDNTMARWSDVVNACRPSPIPPLEDTMQMASAVNKDGRGEEFLLNNGSISHKWRQPDGKWSPRVSFPGGPFAAVTAFANADGRLELVAADAQGNEQHCWQTAPGASWTNWQPL